MGDITISAYNLQFIPLAEDVVSLEHDSAFREIWAVRICEYIAVRAPFDPCLGRR